MIDPLPRGIGGRGITLQPSQGARQISNELGTAVSSAPRGQIFGHPWKPSLSGTGLRLSRGVVIDMTGGQGFEPTINGVRIGGEPGKPQPVLQLDPKRVNDAGESWVCVEVAPAADGVLTQAAVRIVQSEFPKYSGNVAIAREALVLVVWQDNRPRMAEPIARFNLKYLRWSPPAGAGQMLHFFL